MIPVVFCGNKTIFKGILLCSISIAKRTKQPIKVYVLTMDCLWMSDKYTSIDDDQIQRLNDAIKSYNPDNSAVKVDLSKEFEAAFKGGKNLVNAYTPYALLRLLIDDEKCLPEDRCIYLDADTMAVKDLSILFDIDISEYEYAASLDYLGRHWVAKDYCNSGVIYFNLKKCRETGLLKKCRELLYKKHFYMPDQTALYRLYTSRLVVEDKFNEQRDIKEDTVIKHFNKGIIWFPYIHFFNYKMWNIDEVHEHLNIHEFDDDYEVYLKYYKY